MKYRTQICISLAVLIRSTFQFDIVFPDVLLVSHFNLWLGYDKNV